LAGGFYTQAHGINNAGLIVGDYSSGGATHGFLYNGTTYTTIDDPLATSTSAYGINDADQVVGYYTDSSGGTHGFLYDGTTYTTIDDPSATGGTHVLGINNSGQITGYYFDSTGVHGFLATPTSPPPPPPPPPVDEWTNSHGGNWGTASNWSLGVPTAATETDISVSGTYSVTISASDIADGLQLNDAGATVLDNGGGALTLSGTGGSGNPNGALAINAGIFALNGGGLSAGSISIRSGGTLQTYGNYTGPSALSETITDDGTFAIIKASNATISGNISGTGSIVVQDSTKAAFTGAISGSENFTLKSSSQTTFSGAISGSENFSLQDSAKADITTPISGTGSFTLSSSAGLEFGATDSENVAFMPSSSGVLKIDNSLTAPFTGQLSGLSSSNHVDLADLTWVQGHMNAAFNGNTSGGVLTISNGSQSVALNLSGNYTQSTWHLSKDSATGTLVSDPPATSSPWNVADLFAATTVPISDPAMDHAHESALALLGSPSEPFMGLANPAQLGPTWDQQLLALAGDHYSGGEHA
jgi:probable HAF family extracellular repeat protein